MLLFGAQVALITSIFLLNAVVSNCQQFTPPPSYISRFDLVKVPSGDLLQILYDDVVITTTEDFAIVARLEGMPERVTFLNPFFQIEREAPYAIPANFPAGKLRPLKLTVGSYLVTAYVNDAAWNATTIRIFIRPENLPRRGPAPEEISPSYSDPSFIQIMPPVATCKEPKPFLGFRDFSLSVKSKGTYFVTFFVKPCKVSGASDRARLRVLSYESNDDDDSITEVLWAKVVTSGLVQVSIDVRCEKFIFYGELCLDTSYSKWLCATTSFRTVPALPVPPPILSLVPPKMLQLAPGDQVKLVFRTTNNTGSPYWSGVLAGRHDYTLQMFMVDYDGAEIARWGKTKGNTAVARIGGRLCGIPPALDGARVSLRYFEHTCNNSGTFLGEFETVLTVSTDFESLSKQDTRIPSFPQPSYPPTEVGKPARISVTAINRGGGERADGTLSKLQYQWLKRMQPDGLEPMYPTEIQGATGPSILFSSVECDAPCGEMTGCSSDVRYFVDVCNTFGCRRSAAIKPIVFPPTSKTDGIRTWNETSCSWM